MKNFKNKAAALFGVILATSALTGCHGPIEYGELEDYTYDGSEVNITLATTQGATLYPITDAAIDDFMKMYPNIHVTHTQPDGSYDDLRDDIKTQIAIGEQPNIAYCYPDHVALYNKAKVVQTLDGFIDNTETISHFDEEGIAQVNETVGLTAEQKADFIEGYYEEGRQFGDGKMYTLPFSKSTEVLYYNKTFFDAHSLTVPTTWDEMETVCAAIKAIEPTSIPLGYDSESNWFITMCEQSGCGYTDASKEGKAKFTFDNATTRGFVNRFKTWYEKGYVTTQTLYGTYTSGLFTNQDKTASTCYMCIGSSAGASHQYATQEDDKTKLVFEVGITSIPQVDASKPKAISQGPSLCIFKSEDEEEIKASWLLAKYLTTNVAFQAEFSMKSGYVPVIKSVNTNKTYADFTKNASGAAPNGVTALSAKFCIEHTNMFFTSDAFVGSSEARTQVGNLLVGVMNGSKAIDAAYSEALQECYNVVLN